MLSCRISFLLAHQLVMGSLFLIELYLFLGCDVLIAARLVGNVSFAVGLAIEPSAHHAAIL